MSLMRKSKNRSLSGVWLVPIVSSISMAIVAFAVASLLPKKYKSEATLYFPVQADSSSSLANLASTLARGGNFAGDKQGNVSLAFGALSSPLIASGPQTAIAVMDSNRCRQIVVNKLKLAKEWQVANGKALKRLEGDVAMSIDKNGLLAVEAAETDPALAQRILDGYIYALGELSKTLSLNISTKNRQFLEERVRGARARMQRLERKLEVATVSDPNVAEMNAPSEAARGLIELESKLSAAQVTLSGVTRQLTFTQEKAREVLKSGADLPISSDIGKLQRERLAELEYQFGIASQELGPDNPRYRLLKDQLSTARGQLVREITRETKALNAGIQPEVLRLSAEQASLEAQVAGLTRSFNEVRGRLAAIPARQLRLGRLEYELKAIREQLMNYELDLAKARIAEDRDAITFQVVDKPEIPEEPFAPRRLYSSALAGLAGLLIGIAFLVAKSSLRSNPLDLPVERDVALV
jgi:uncharacterized protein involved in exopolysaccharide biosynthesis